MMNAQLLHRVAFVAVSLAPTLLVGCGGPSIPVGEVEGVLLINGQPAGNMFVQFIPEAGGEASPPPSNANTDESGHFVLNMIEPDGSMRPGAAVGTHRVVLRDLQAASAPNPGAVRIRIPVQYTMPGATPLTQSVKEGKQTIEIKVPPR